jgi:hypothetical protein
VAIAALALAPADDGQQPAEAPATTAASEGGAATADTVADVSVEPLRFDEPDEVRGVHIDYVSAGDTDKMNAILAAADPDSGLNTIQLDVKDERGRIGIPMALAAAKRAKAIDPAYDPVKLIKRAHEAGLYTIARVVAFQDPRYAAVAKGAALDRKGGGVWENDLGLAWIDPTDKRAQDYVIAVAKAAADAGFDEVMFDYVRFPTDGAVDSAVFSRPNASKDKTIAGFLQRAGQVLRPQGVKVSAAVFGIQATSQADIGQDPALLKNVLDTISPMVYPSHFGSGQFDIDNPTANPYDTVTASLLDWQKWMVNGRARLRPWLQDFTYNGVTYGSNEVLAQVKAARDLDTDGYLLWNISGDYSPGVLTP